MVRRLRKLMPRGREQGYETRSKVLLTKDDEYVRIHGLLNCGWLDRIWTFQEIILSRNPVILCGDSTISWEDMINAVYAPDRSPDMNTALVHWRSLARLWFRFPRRRSHHQPPRLCKQEQGRSLEGAAEGEGEATYSFKELVDAFHDREGIRVVPILLYIPCITLVFAALLAATGICEYELGKLFWVVSKEVLIAILPGMLLVFILGGTAIDFLLPIFHSFFVYVLYGEKHKWLLSEEQMDEGDDDDYDDGAVPAMIRTPWRILRSRLSSRGRTLQADERAGLAVDILNGVWMALRKRKSSMAHDKSFGLFAILSTCGARPSPSNYSHDIKETYRTLFHDLLSWQPTAITLILDGCVENPIDPSWPSWLPDWRTAERNGWLVNRFCLGGPENAAPLPPHSRIPTISGDSLHLSGQCFGEILSHFHFDAITDTGDSEQLLPALTKLVDWMRAVKTKRNSMRLGALFAVLEGRSPQSRALSYPRWSPGRYPGMGTTRSILRNDWEAPYDFSDLKDQYIDFVELYKLVIKEEDEPAAPEGADANVDTGADAGTSAGTSTGTGVNTNTGENTEKGADADGDIPVEEVLVKIQDCEAALGCLVRIVNKLVDENRCLFVLSGSMGGSGPLGIAAGNEVLLVPGVRAPLAVRHREGRQGVYRLVGPVLVHGLMFHERFRSESVEDIIIE